MKTCPQCKESKSVDLFYRQTGKKDGLRRICKMCDLSNNKRYKANRSPEKRAEQNLASRNATMKKRFGLTPEQYDEMVESQNGLCALCDKPPRGSKALDVDHNHATGQVRMLLCNPCNQGLGIFQDDPLLLEKAARYLRKFQQ